MIDLTKVTRDEPIYHFDGARWNTTKMIRVVDVDESIALGRIVVEGGSSIANDDRINTRPSGGWVGTQLEILARIWENGRSGIGRKEPRK